PRRKGRKVPAKTLRRRFFVVRGAGRRGWTTTKGGETRNSHLHAGIYERIKQFSLRSVFVFVRGATYRPVLDIYGVAQRTYDRVMPYLLMRAIQRAVESSAYRRRSRRARPPSCVASMPWPVPPSWAPAWPMQAC